MTRLILLLLLLLPGFGRSLPAQAGEPGIGWVGLFNDALVAWLENENRLTDLCGGSAVDESWYRCRNTQLAPKVHVVPLRSLPHESSRPGGALIIVAAPGKGLAVFYAGVGGGAATRFTPDLFDPDWGYGPYFHLTIVERRGDWIRLPADPFPPDTWFNSRDLSARPAVLWLEPGSIVTSPRGDLHVLEVDGMTVRARLEQPADMWCEAGDPPPVRPAPEIRLRRGDLYTATGHLRLGIKYTRGC